MTFKPNEKQALFIWKLISAETPEQREPMVVSVSKAGDFYLNIGEDNDKPIEADLLVNRVAAVISNHPQTPVLVRGDRAVDYGRVTEAMVLLQSAGVEKVGLMTESQDH